MVTIMEAWPPFLAALELIRALQVFNATLSPIKLLGRPYLEIPLRALQVSCLHVLEDQQIQCFYFA